MPGADVHSDRIVEARSWFAAEGHYLDTASIGLPTAATVEAVGRAVDDWRRGTVAAPDYDRWVTGSREAFAALVGVGADAVAVGSQVSAFVGLVASSLPGGTEVVCPEDEFTSVLFPFLVRHPQLRVRTVPLEALAEAVGPQTAAVAFSLVQSADGRVADDRAIVAAAEQHAALTLVDATQACGWLPVEADRFDILVAGAYKWLLAPRGTAFMVIRRDRLEAVIPRLAGWYAGEDVWDSIYGRPLRLASSARRFDLSPAWLPWVGTLPALEAILAVGVETIHRHDVTLANRLREGLGLPPGDSAVVSVALPAGGMQRLRDAGIRASERAGRARLSFHLYNDGADVDAVLGALTGRGAGRC